MAGQCEHFRYAAPEKIPYAIDRYTKEVERLFAVIERRLQDRQYLAGAYSIADIANFTWTRVWPELGQDIRKFPNVERWLERVAARPAVARGLSLKKPEAPRKHA
jgi:GST-like protein